MSREALAMALDYHGAGFCPLSLPYGKKWDRSRWKHYQNRQASRPEVLTMFGDGEHNVALMGGRASRNAMVLDCENKAAFERWFYTLAGLGVRTWVVQRDPNGSKHDGGGHFYLRTPKPVQSKQYDGYEVKAQGGYTLAPYSLHPGGTIYRTTVGDPYGVFELPKMTTIPELALYEAPPEPSKSRLAWKLLKGDSETIARYHSRSEADAALCVSLINTGHTLAHVRALFSKYATSGKYNELQAVKTQHAEHYLMRTFTSALEFATSNTSPAILLAVALAEWANDRRWLGRSGGTDRAIYLAHLEIVRRCARNPYGASCRELAAIAGTGHKTATRATDRLIAQDLLEVTAESKASLSTRYRLLEPEGLEFHSDTLPHMGGIESVSQRNRTLEESLDVWRWSGLGKTGAQVYAMLAERGRLTAVELVELTGRAKATVWRKLQAMQALGLAEQIEETGQWVLDDLGDLSEAARELGTAGLADRQRQRHARQRALHWAELSRGRR